MKNSYQYILGGLVISCSLLLTACDRPASTSVTQPPHPVGVVTLRTQPLAVQTELPGRVSAFRVADVRPQVNGIILKRHFVEGSHVTAGESLYQIDPSTYQAALNSAKGDLAKATAAATQAHLTANRYRALLKTHYVSQQDYDTAVANAEQADAQVVAQKAVVEQAQINLNYTQVTSPISGIIGKSNVTEGALVTDSQSSALATVQQLNPVYIDVTQSSDDFLNLKSEMEKGEIKQQNGNAEVLLQLDNGRLYPQQCRLEFSDVTVDQTTGSITVRAECPNPDNTLLPGMFVRAHLTEGMRENALLVPQQAITRTPRGDATTMVVDSHNHAQVRRVQAAQAMGNQWRVTSGLTAGDRVIVTGQLMLRPGMPVTATEDDSMAAWAQGSGAGR
ncbi:efflux RND transporter periplasmic adaptor subunit [Citrobacter sp. R56]|uniref:efflux RND transporter periplasmic adaptor subunit n=1 Tax=Citrobacter sp. R56 TaxID=1573676 RepID=UPI00193B8443|nr:efflux RND transporter periplasmic adaptor subunit [Citrobacter sp. R56]QRG77214.1 efflux RND transporter periplasmic adaptor subunit [Citrobacter sp. R56]